MPRFRLYFCLLLLAATLAGCRSLKKQADAPPPLPEVTIHVQNNNVLDVIVYAIRDAMNERLGTVATTRTATFMLPGYVLTGGGVVRFVAHPIGSNVNYVIDELLVNPGDEVYLRVPSHAGR